MTDENVAWVDKQILSKLWVNILQKATYAMMDNDYRIYKRGIDILTSSLFKEERDQVIAYRNSFKEMNMDAYMCVQQFIIDLLEKKGYLKYKTHSLLETHEGKKEREWEK